ncbi:MAG: glycosyltransferase family 4 protein [Candidatus Margulisiibacteriota bacterium]
MKKILFYTDSKEFGGAEHYLSVVLRRISRQKYTPLLAFGLNPLRFALLLRREKPDIVHFNLPLAFSCAAALIVCGRFKKIKITGTVHSVEPPSSRFPFLKHLKKLTALRTLKLVQRFICVSQKSKETFCKNYNITPERVSVVYNGLDVFETEDFAPAKKLKVSLGIKENEFVVGTVSRLVNKKGIEVLLKAFSRISIQKDRQKLLIVGDGILKGRLIKAAKKLGLKGRVIFAGHQNDVLPFLLAMDLFVMPSLSESMPFALMEAMAAGRAVISTEVGGVKELVCEEENGLLIPPADPERLCNAISLLSGDRTRLYALGKAAKKHMADNFSIDSMTRGTGQFFDAVVLSL